MTSQPLTQTARASLAVALCHVLRTFGSDVQPEQLLPALESYTDWSDAPGLDDIDTGQYGTYPYNSPSIVRFDDGSYHYVDSPADRTIIDSGDGQSKRMEVYGTPNAWATFAANTDKPVPKPEPMVYITNTINGIKYDLLKPKAPQKMYVTRPEGIDLMDFSGSVSTYRDFMGVPDTHLPYGAEVRIMGTAHHPVIPSGYDFYIPQEPVNVWGEFTRTGKPAAFQGYRMGDLSPTPPPPKRPKEPAPVVDIAPARLAPTAQDVADRKPLTDIQPTAPSYTPEELHFQYLNDARQSVRYQVMQRVQMTCYGPQGNGHKEVLTRGKKLNVLGTFRQPGSNRIMLLIVPLDNSDPFPYLAGILEIDLLGNRNAEEIPDYTDIQTASATTIPERQALGTATPIDHLVAHATKLEVSLQQGVYRVRKLFIKRK